MKCEVKSQKLGLIPSSFMLQPSGGLPYPSGTPKANGLHPSSFRSRFTTKKMLHLAQVQRQGLLGSLGLRLLARQETEYHWTLITERTVIPEVEIVLNDSTLFPLTEGLLVLVEVSPIGEIESLENASNWVLELVKTYLTNGITPAFLQQEIERAEQWRQSLTLQTQELARRALEVEARREQIQALEESLRRDQESSNHNL